MKSSLAAGVASTVRHTVDRERTIGFMGENARVYATPMLVRDIEMASRELLLSHLDPGEDSVGTRIELDHLAATLQGMLIVAGTALPLALVAAAGFAASDVALALTGIAGLVAALAGAFVKLTLITRAGFNQGFALPHLPVRGART